MEVLLSHYFQPDAPIDVRQEALADWIEALVEFPAEAVDHACRGYMRDQPRRRPTPGDIIARCKGWQQERERARISGKQASLAHQRAVEWAGKSERLDETDAWDALARMPHLDFPHWLPDDETQRAVYAITQHENAKAPSAEGAAEYRKMVRASR